MTFPWPASTRAAAAPACVALVGLGEFRGVNDLDDTLTVADQVMAGARTARRGAGAAPRWTPCSSRSGVAPRARRHRAIARRRRPPAAGRRPSGTSPAPPVLVLDELDEDTTPEETAAVLNALRALTATGVTVRRRHARPRSRAGGRRRPGAHRRWDAGDGRPPLPRRPRLPGRRVGHGASAGRGGARCGPFEIGLLELKRLVSARPFRLALAVVCLVPLLYGVLYLWAFWDPYQRLDKLPVALVVEDRAVHRPTAPRSTSAGTS